MKQLITFIYENLKNHKLYHTAKTKIEKLENTPMFFAVEKNHAVNGWLKNFNDEGIKGIVYELTYNKATILNIYDDIISSIAEQYNIDVEDYIYDIIANPTTDEIEQMELTKHLIENNIDGIIYDDYDPRNNQNDLEAVLLFRPKSVCETWKQIQY